MHYFKMYENYFFTHIIYIELITKYKNGGKTLRHKAFPSKPYYFIFFRCFIVSA